MQKEWPTTRGKSWGLVREGAKGSLGGGEKKKRTRKKGGNFKGIGVPTPTEKCIRSRETKTILGKNREETIYAKEH